MTLKNTLLALALTPLSLPLHADTTVVGNTLAEARNIFAQTGAVRQDCDPVGDGRWICSSKINPTLEDLSTTATPVEPQPPVIIPTLIPSFDYSLPSDTIYQRGDLISLHFDSCPDLDDVDSAVATKMVLDHFNIRIDTDFMVLNGACGMDLPQSHYQPQSTEIFEFLYGSNGSTQTWSNVFDFEQQTVAAFAEKWRQHLVAGRKVFVIEGGPSDITAKIIRALESGGFGGNLKNIHVVQHSQGFNQDNTLDSNLAFVKYTTDYRLIDNGNLPNNTPALAMNNFTQDTRYTRVDQALVNRYRNNPTYGPAWTVALRVGNRQDKFDFSDTVELLYILGIEANDIADIYDFADRFLPTVDFQPQPAPATPIDVPTPIPPVIVPTDPIGVIVSGNNLADARLRFAQATDLRRVDCD